MLKREDFMKLRFKVVKIVGSEHGEDKSTEYPHCNMIDKVVKFYNAPYEGSGVVFIVEEDGNIARTSRVEDFSFTAIPDMTKRVVLETKNTVYYLDEVKGE